MVNCRIFADFVISRIINVALVVVRALTKRNPTSTCALKGTILPNGEAHDGYFVVRDAGGAINGHGRFDFFTGFFTTKHPENSFTKIKLNGLQIFPEYFLVEGDEAERVRQERNFPLLPGKDKVN